MKYIKRSFKRLIKENNNEDYFLKNPQVITSGWEFNITLALTDSKLNLLVFDNFSRASIVQDRKASEPNASKYIIIEKAEANCLKGIFKFQNMKIIATPNSTYDFIIKVNYGSDLFFKSKLSDLNNTNLMFEKKMRLFVRPCQRGEILTVDETCHKCEQGKISYIKRIIELT